LTDNKLK